MEMQTPVGEGQCPYPVHDFNDATIGPVLSHAEAIDQLRNESPFIWSTFGNGFWVFNEDELIRETLQSPELFSSSVVTVHDSDPPYKWIPEMLDPPEHTVWRQLLAPHFAPKAMERLEDKVRARCASLIEGFAGKGHCDFLQDFARRFPTTIFMELMGLPVESLDQFLTWEHEILHLPAGDDRDHARAFNAMLAVMGYFAELIEEKRISPSEDLLSHSLTWRINDRPIPNEDLLSWCLLMFMAGLDTVSIQLAYSFWHLGGHPADRAQIGEDPSIVPAAVEEFLRHFAFVAPARKVMHDTDFHGCPLKSGDMVYVPISGATRDPASLEGGGMVDFGRLKNNHIAFGAGPHRCLGSHLARRELRVALEEWHRRIPDYWLTEGVEVTEHGGGLYGIDHLELSWNI
jgi:cytochrome P450